MTTSHLSRTYRSSHKVLIEALISVTLYAIGMVIAGEPLNVPLFDALQFGRNTRAKAIDYSMFAFGVFGGSTHWLDGATSSNADFTIADDADVRAKARLSMVLSVGVWFVWDTGFSLISTRSVQSAVSYFVAGPTLRHDAN